MHGVAVLLVAASIGVDYGWQADDDGTLEYIIQLEPELISALQKGEAVISEIHPDVQGVRRFRIQIGTAPLPRVSPPSKGATPAPMRDPMIQSPVSSEDDATPFPTQNHDSSPTTPSPTDFELTPLPETEANPPLPPTTPPTDFPLTPLPDVEKIKSSEPSDAARNDFPLPTSAPESKPTVSQPPVEAPRAPTNQETQTTHPERPIPLPDPDRLPLEPATLPFAEKGAPSQAISIAESHRTKPRLASFESQKQTSTKATTNNSDSQNPSLAPVRRPWFLFSVTLLALLGSLGANAYLGYLFFGLQQRYQGLRLERKGPVR